MNETAVKKTPSMTTLTVTLLLITAAVALCLSLVNYITADRIEALRAEKTANAMREVFPGEYDFTQTDGQWPSSVVDSVYAVTAKNGSSIFGWVVQAEPSGFGGAISMVVGIDLDGNVTGVSIISMSETSGLGANAAREDFRSQYNGSGGPFAVDKDGGDINSLTGATITSRAVTDGVNAALEAVASLG